MDYSTPQWLFDILDQVFNFETDLAADKNNKKCNEYLDEELNSLEREWGFDGWSWLNPPYGRKIGEWIKKAYEEHIKGSDICMLIPARTDTNYFHKYITKSKAILLLKGRLKFGNEKNSAPFPSMLVFFGNITEFQINKLNSFDLGFLIEPNKTFA